MLGLRKQKAPLTLVRRVAQLDGDGKPVRDRYGRDVVVETTENLDRYSLQPVSTAETLGSADMTVSVWQLFTAPDLDLTSVDAVRSGTLTLEVVGDPRIWPAPSGRPHHVEILLRKAAG